MSKITYRKALITGGTSGLGKGLADALRSQGIEVTAIGSKDYDLRGDLTPLLNLIEQEAYDLVVNNAGIGIYGPLTSLSPAETFDLITINITALVAITQAAIKRPCTVLNIASAGALISFPTHAIYCASKAFVLNFSRAVDAESPDSRILCALPGQIATGFQAHASRGKNLQISKAAMTIDRAVSYLLKQLASQKSTMIFGWRTRLMILLSHILPRSLLNALLKRGIRNRY